MKKLSPNLLIVIVDYIQLKEAACTRSESLVIYLLEVLLVSCRRANLTKDIVCL